jgi:hypothetical protein
MSQQPRPRRNNGRFTRNSRGNSGDGRDSNRPDSRAGSAEPAGENSAGDRSGTPAGSPRYSVGQQESGVRGSTPTPSVRGVAEPRATGTRIPLPEGVPERNAVLRERVTLLRMQRQNQLLEAELEGVETVEVVPIEGVSIPVRVQTAGHKHRLSEHASDQMGAMKRMQGPPPKFSGKDLKELQDYEVKWLNRYSSSEMGGVYPRVPDASRVAIAAGALDGMAAYQWSRKTEEEQKSYTVWDDFIVYLRTLVADPENRLAAATLELKESRQKSGQTVRELQQHIDEVEGNIPKDMPEEQRRAYQLLNSLQPALRTHVLRQQEKITSVDSVLVIASRQEQLSALAPGHKRDDDGRRSSSSSSWPSSRRGAPSSYRGRSRDAGLDKSREVPRTSLPEQNPNDGRCWHCGGYGHIARSCNKQPRRTETARVSHVSSNRDDKDKPKETAQIKNSKPTL